MEERVQPAGEKLRELFAKMFGLAIEDVTDAASIHSVEGWDSLKHINLMLAIEEEFGVSLSPEEVESMISFGLIKSVLKDHGIEVE